MAIRVVVLGAGPGGYVAALRAAQGGAEVTVIEKAHVGGTCLNQGCIPSKALISSVEMLEDLRRAHEFGIQVEGSVKPDIQRIVARKNEVVETLRKGILHLFKSHKVRHLEGVGFLPGPGAAVVRTPAGEEIEAPWDKLIVATGTRVLELPSLPFDGERVLSSDHALSLASIPASVVIVGGGVIGCEFACILQGLGAEVTLVEAMDRLLPIPGVDEECSKLLQREMTKRKVRVLVNRTVDGFEEANGKLAVTIGPSPLLENPTERDRRPTTVEVEKILVCIGRRPNTEGIGLETIGLRPDGKGWIAADDGMRTSVPDVYAIGDILGPARFMLAHVASAEAEIAVANMLGRNERMDYRVVPSGIFTSPEVANVGLTEKQAAALGVRVRGDTVLFRALGKAQVMGSYAGQAKNVSDAETGKVLGVHIIGPHATDLIAEGTLAAHLGARVQEIAATIHAHPTLSEIMLEAAFKATDRPLHGG